MSSHSPQHVAWIASSAEGPSHLPHLLRSSWEPMTWSHSASCKVLGFYYAEFQALEEVQGPLQKGHPAVVSPSPSPGGCERLTSATGLLAARGLLGILPVLGKDALSPVPPGTTQMASSMKHRPCFLLAGFSMILFRSTS